MKVCLVFFPYLFAPPSPVRSYCECFLGRQKRLISFPHVLISPVLAMGNPELSTHSRVPLLQFSCKVSCPRCDVHSRIDSRSYQTYPYSLSARFFFFIPKCTWFPPIPMMMLFLFPPFRLELYPFRSPATDLFSSRPS